MKVMGGRIVYNNFLCLALVSCAVIMPASVHATPVSTAFPGAEISPFAPDLRSFLTVSSEDADQVGKGAMDFIGNMGQRAIGFLSNGSLSADQKRASFRTLLQESFDMKTIGRFSLGRYWRVASPEQRKEYQSLFDAMVISVYSQRFSDYQGQRFETRGFRTDSPTDAIVTSFIVPESGPEVQVDWRVRYKNGQYKIIDVIVEGVSMSVTQRSDFSSVIQRGGGDVQVLLDHLADM